ncbi:MAG: hypothetical protein JNM25_17300 [Planctomycetes bacterium]|nr:hypothetical protein [Planctomycetota bacterium]
MATKPASPPVPPNPADQLLDDHTGVYGFFRRHQKKLLYTAGLFTLLTFSVTGPMLTAVDSLFGKRRDMPSIQVGGQRVKLEPLDYQFGSVVARNLTNMQGSPSLPPVLPVLGTGEGGSNDLADMLAILRRAAIAEGIDVSMAEVDRAIEVLREQSKVESAARLAGYRGFHSLAEYREVVKEAMRIGTYVRLQTLALDGSDAKVLDQVVADREKVTFRVATFDEKALEQQLKAGAKPTDDELKSWLETKSEIEKARIQVYDSNHLELRFGALLLADGQFDATQWADVLKDFQPAEDQLSYVYEQEKELRFKLEGDKNYKPLEEVKGEITRLLQAEQVMNHLFAELKKELDAALKQPNEELQRCQTELGEANGGVKELEAKLAGQPADAAAVEEQLRLAKETLAAKQAAVTAAGDAVKAARAGWDFPAAFARLTEGKSGFEQKAMTGRRSLEDLKDLDAAGVGYGKWPSSAQARAIQAKGDFCGGPGRADKALLLYQATDVLVRPLKPWDALQPLLEGAYFTEKAKTEGEAKKKLMEDALLRLAKAKMAEQVATIEATRATKVDERMAEWERTTQAGIVEAQGWLQRLAAGTQAQIAWQRKLDTLQAQVADKDKQRATFDAEVGKAIEEEIATEAKKHYGEVLEAAAAEAGFTLATLDPHPRNLSSLPRFDKAYDETTVFLFRNHAELEAGATTGVVQDATNRRWLVAVCDKVEPLQPSDVTRRDFESQRTGDGLFAYSTQRAYRAYGQAFTIKALETRYDLKRPVGEQEMPPAPNSR